MNIVQSKYSGAFVAGALLHDEMTAMLPLLLHPNRVKLVKEEVKNNQYLGIQAQLSRTRVMIEVERRFDNVPLAFWEHYQTCSTEEQKVLLFYVALNTYKLLFDFHTQVTMPNWKEGYKELQVDSFMAVLNKIAMYHPEINDWSEKTLKKCISVYMRMLRQVGLLAVNSKRFKTLSMDEPLYNYFLEIEEPWFLDACLLSPEKRNEIIKSYLNNRK